MDDPGLRSAPAGRIEAAARIVVHVADCHRATDLCPICAPLYERTTTEQGGFDIAVAALAAALENEKTAGLRQRSSRALGQGDRARHRNVSDGSTE